MTMVILAAAATAVWWMLSKQSGANEAARRDAEKAKRLKALTMYIGQKAYSSWSLRSWLAIRVAAGSADGFVEAVVNLEGAGRAYGAHKCSPTGKVPALHDGITGAVVWDSLAINEYLAEIDPSLWPANSTARAVARAACAEMHSGFEAIRSQMPMNTRKIAPAKDVDAAVAADVARICSLWEQCRAYGKEAGGPFLFGKFSIADAMYAPVVFRFRTYAPPGISAVAAAYCKHMLSMPEMVEWCKAADEETWRIQQYEK